jgi:hypothetical protein
LRNRQGYTVSGDRGPWYHDSAWRLIGAIVLGGVLLDAFFGMHHSRRPVAEFAESLVASLIHATLLIGPLAAGIATGLAVTRRTGGQSGLGWIAGVIVWVLLGLGFLMLVEQIPGVGWRVRARMDSAGESADY